tara:strand:+ start:13436 stop:14512 length:1077 start_codon:yes stop_codon:yes gene_type:complete
VVQLKINKKGKIGLILIFLWHTLVFTQNGTTIALDKEQIITSDNYHNSFPSVVKLEEGQVLVSYRKGKGHLSPVASAVYKTSNDNGKSFQNELIIENGNDFINTKHGIRNLIINELNDGRLLATFWINDYPKGNTYYKISEDQGLTWGERKEVLDKNTITNFIGVEGRMIEINGDYILPVFVKKSLISNNMYAGVMISRDLVNWTYYEVSRKISDNNESVILFGNNHWQLLYFYRNVTENALYRSESHDLGRTWSNPENVSFPGYVQSRPDIAFYPDNNQMYLLYREGKYQTGTIAVSHDKGLTWKRLTGIYKDSTRFTYGGMVNVKRNKSILIYSTETHLNGVNSTIKNRFLRLKKD